MTAHALLTANISKHITLTPAEADQLPLLFKLQHIKRREFLLAMDDVCSYEYFVNRGCLRSFYIDKNNKEHTLMFAVEGWWTGSLHSFLTRSPSRHAIEAMEDTEVLRISRTNLDALYERVPKMDRFFRIILQNALIGQQYRVIDNASCTADELYMRFITKYPQLARRVPQKYIASYLGMTPAYMSRLQKKHKSSLLLT